MYRNIANALVSISIIFTSINCAPARERASEKNLPPIAPVVWGDSAGNNNLRKLAEIKKSMNGNNQLIALTFSDGAPKEVPSNWSALNTAFSKLAEPDVKLGFLPWDFFISNGAPVVFPVGIGISVSGVPTAIVIDPQTNEKKQVVRDDFAQIVQSLKNPDGTPPRFRRIRITTKYERGIKDLESGFVARALITAGLQSIEPSLEVTNGSTVDRFTVIINEVLESGLLGPVDAEVSANLTRLTAKDKFGLIITSSGGAAWDTATVQHSEAELISETTKHAVFVYMAKALGVDYESLLRNPGALPRPIARATNETVRPTPGDIGAARGRAPKSLSQDVGQTSRDFSLRLRQTSYIAQSSIRLLELHGESALLEVENLRVGGIKEERLFLGEEMVIEDTRIPETRHVRLVNIMNSAAHFTESIERSRIARGSSGI